MKMFMISSVSILLNCSWPKTAVTNSSLDTCMIKLRQDKCIRNQFLPFMYYQNLSVLVDIHLSKGFFCNVFLAHLKVQLHAALTSTSFPTCKDSRRSINILQGLPGSGPWAGSEWDQRGRSPAVASPFAWLSRRCSRRTLGRSWQAHLGEFRLTEKSMKCTAVMNPISYQRGCGRGP